MKRLLFLFLLAASVSLWVSCGRNYEATELTLIPTPSFQVMKEGSFTLSAETKLSLANLGQNTLTAKYVSRSLRKMHFVPTFIGGDQDGGILLRINDSVNDELGTEGYILEVSNSGIVISANTESGLFYGYQTLLQMFPSDVFSERYSNITIPACTILDNPRFEWRSCRIDVTRHFFSVDDLKHILDVMAMYKYNRLVLCLADDYGWRLESSLFPALSEVGAWRPERSDWDKALPPQPDEKASYGGAYSRSQIDELVQYAQSLRIEIIPEVSLPAHCSALLASYPQYACARKDYHVQCGPQVDADAVICLGNDSTLTHMLRMIDEVSEWFPGRYLSLGGDTVAAGAWSHCPRCRYRMIENSLRGERSLHAWFVNYVAEHLSQQNRRVLVWDDLLTDNLSNDVILMVRSSISDGMKAAKKGHDVVMCMSDYCSFDHYQADARYQTQCESGCIDLRKVYDFDPAPTGSNTHLIPSILGGQCQINTAYVTELDQLEYQLLPRLCAHAEALWTPRASKDWRQFRYSVETHKSMLKTKGFNVCPGSFKPLLTKITNAQGETTFSLETEVMNTYVFFTTDGSEPTQSSQIYVAPVKFQSGTVVKTLSVYDGQAREGIYEYHI